MFTFFLSHLHGSATPAQLIQVVSKMVTFDPTVRISVADTLRLKPKA